MNDLNSILKSFGLIYNQNQEDAGQEDIELIQFQEEAYGLSEY